MKSPNTSGRKCNKLASKKSKRRPSQPQRLNGSDTTADKIYELSKPIGPKFDGIANVLIWLWLSSLGSVFSQTPAPTEPPSTISAQEPALAEKIGDTSPDKKFAVRIRYDAEANKKLLSEQA